MGPGDVILALDSPTSSAMASWALGGLHSLPSSPPSSKPCRGHQSQRAWTTAAVLRALPAFGNFVFHSLKPSTLPLFPMPGKVWEALLHLLYFPVQQTVTGSFSTSATLLAKSIPPSSSLPGQVTGAGIPPCMVPWQWLALLPTRMLPGCAIPPCQQLRKAPQGVQGDHSPAAC